MPVLLAGQIRAQHQIMPIGVETLVGHDGDRQVFSSALKIARRDAPPAMTCRRSGRKERNGVCRSIDVLDLDLDADFLEVALVDCNQFGPVRHRARHSDMDGRFLRGCRRHYSKAERHRQDRARSARCGCLIIWPHSVPRRHDRARPVGAARRDRARSRGRHGSPAPSSALRKISARQRARLRPSKALAFKPRRLRHSGFQADCPCRTAR